MLLINLPEEHTKTILKIFDDPIIYLKDDELGRDYRGIYTDKKEGEIPDYFWDIVYRVCGVSSQS